MSLTRETIQARRYLLGEATDDESAAIEQEYFDNHDAVERMSAAEDDLIEEYLSNQLSPAERSRFERAYLSVHHRRLRVETVRRLIARASEDSRAQAPSVVSAVPTRMSRPLHWLALAAAVTLVVSGGLWLFERFGTSQSDVVDNRAVPESPTTPQAGESPSGGAAAPRVFAILISPVTVRSASESSRFVVPAATDVVALRLELEPDARRLTPRRVTIRTVDGQEVWQGPVSVDPTTPAGTAVRAEVPPDRLRADDYLVTLYGTDQTTGEQEWSQYFLRIRAR